MHWINSFYKKYSFGADKRITAARPDLADISLKNIIEAENYSKGTLFQCALGNVALRNSRDPASTQTSELLFGEHFLVFEDKEGWAWGQAQYDKYVGYLPSFALKPFSGNVVNRISNPLTWAYSEPDLKSPPIRGLPLAGCLPEGEGEEQKGFVHFPDIGWVWKKHFTPLSEPLDYMATAEKFLNVPYLWGGKTAMGMDCSGLVQVSMGLAGVPLPRDTDQQEKALSDDFNITNWTEKGALKRGDLVFFPGHIGFMVDDKNLLHANATHMATTIDPLEDVIEIVSQEQETPVTSVKRVSK